MKTHLLSIATLGAFAFAASSAMAAPVKLSKAQMDNVVAGTGDTCTCDCYPPPVNLKGNNGYGQEKHGAPVDPLPPGAANGAGASNRDKPSSFGVR